MIDFTKLSADKFNELDFIREEWYDYNHPKDTVFTLKFVRYKRLLGNGDLAIEITFAFISEDGINYEQVEAVQEIVSKDTSTPINNELINDLKGIFNLINEKKLCHLNHT